MGIPSQASSLQSQRSGTVVVSHGPELLVDLSGQLVACRGRRKLGKAVCGDQVVVSADEPPMLERIEPRRNVFPRADRRGRKQVVAANLDRAVIVVAPQPAPTRDLINRYLVACASLNLEAVICINKQDLMADEDAATWEASADLYRQLGYPVAVVSTKTEPWLGQLTPLLNSGPSILVGQSGVGKSSIINHLLPDLALKTQAISNATAKGRHTTTATTWYERQDGGPIIDSPGVWEYGVWQMPWEEVAAGFVEFGRFAQDCRFANCQHIQEPGCGVEAAVSQGMVSSARLASYRRIVASLARLDSGY